MSENNYFEELNKIDCSDKIEKKNGLSFLSWAFAWGEVKKKHPDATYKIYEKEDGRIYWDDGRTCWVKTGVTINNIEHIEYLPVMDFKNNSIPYDKVTSFDVNKAIQRSLTKACARHGLGLYIYAGEDLPEEAVNAKKMEEKTIQENLEKELEELLNSCVLGKDIKTIVNNSPLDIARKKEIYKPYVEIFKEIADDKYKNTEIYLAAKKDLSQVSDVRDFYDVAQEAVKCYPQGEERKSILRACGDVFAEKFNG